MLSNIETELQTIQNGRYGEDVRGAIHDAIEKVNSVDISDTHKNITLEEYEALTDEEKNDGTVYFITDSDGVSDVVSRDEVYTMLETKQDKLAFDSQPVYASDNPVKSGGVYKELQKAFSTIFGSDFSAITSVDNAAGFHNSIFRGKYLGDEFTEEQSAVITAGTFDDLFVGDYWTINGVNWRIADFDTYYRCGDTELNTHHIAVVPDTRLYSCVWNETNNTVTGGVNGGAGYVDSFVRANIKATSDTAAGAEEKVIAAFGDSHVLSYRTEYPTTYSADGVATGLAWTDARVELMNEVEVYGAPMWSAGGLGYEVGINKRQLSLFRLSPQFISIRANWWLRGVRSAAYACHVTTNGCADYTRATYSLGVRPLTLIA